MTYGTHPRQCSGYCSGWQSFPFDFRTRAVQLQPLESALHCLRSRMDVPLRYDNATVPGDPHDGEGVHTRFTEPSQHGMTKRVQNKIASKEVRSRRLQRRYLIDLCV
jgi:hypothetical protein